MLRRIVLTAAATLVAASSLHAQKKDSESESIVMTVKVAGPPPRAYRTALMALTEMGFPTRALFLNEVIITNPRPDPELEGLGASAGAVMVEFAAKGDSTEMTIQSMVVPTSGEACQGARCTQLMSATLMTSARAVSAITDAMEKLPPPRRTAADSLAEAGAYGYSSANPIRVGGGLERGSASEHSFLDSLRGPGGEPVKYMRLGSCCEYPVPGGPRGKGFLDAYELSYAGLAQPVLVYISMYETDAPRAPRGFTQGAASAPETTRR